MILLKHWRNYLLLVRMVIIVAMLINTGSDSSLTEAVVKKIEETFGRPPEEMSLDAGYYSEKNLKFLELKKIDTHMPHCRLKHREYCNAVAEEITEASSIKDRMKSKILTEQGRKKYGLRKETAEPLFEQIGVSRFPAVFNARRGKV